MSDKRDYRKEGEDWMSRLEQAKKREKEWREDAEAAEKAYACDANTDVQGGKLYDFNILHSNVETIVPAIYNSTPIPDVRRRFVQATGPEPQQPQMLPGQQPNPQAIMAFRQSLAQWQQKKAIDEAAKNYGDMVERAISVVIDDNRLDTQIEKEAQDSFLAGRGILRIRFEADVTETYADQSTEQEPLSEEQAPEDEPVVQEQQAQTQVSNERITFEAVSWRDFRMGKAKLWRDVPWVAFRHCMSEGDATEFQDEEMVSGQTKPEDRPGDYGEDDVKVWEVWCRKSKTVKFIREHDNVVIKEIDDPLGLRDFFPMPEPVQPIHLTGKLTPVCPFAVYRKLANEADLATRRINAIMKGLKVRGVAIGGSGDLARLSDADDNQIIMANDLEQLAQTGGIDKAIMWWPIDQAAKVLEYLLKHREEVKQQIYEITGISDIVRGASHASETATAQQIKTQWGSLRIQKMQRLIERQVRDVFCIMAEIITSKFSEQTLYQMTGIEITDGIRALMRQPVLASYRVDVESDSTVRADLTRQKQEMGEFLNGTANFFKVMGPMLNEAPDMAEPVAEIYASFARVFRLGKQAEDALERMSEMAKAEAGKAQNKPNPEMEKIKAQSQTDMAKAQMDNQQKMADVQQRANEAAQRIAMDKWKATIDALTKLEVAQINAKQQSDAGLLEKQFEALIGVAEMAHDRQMAREQQAHEAATQQDTEAA